jgi:8-oxo-dGTP pyrophosphatase MutT (NUDIX family)
MIIRPRYCSLRKLRTAALRELHEETGYGSGNQGEGNAKIHKVSDILVKDPGQVNTLQTLGGYHS